MAKEKDDSRIAGFRISKTAALAIAIALIIVIVLVLFLAVRMMTAPRPSPPPVNVGGLPTATPYIPPGTTATPYSGTNYSVSPLVDEYGVDSTPQLVVNCNTIRIGTFAAKEQSGEVPLGTERQDLINSLCSITGRQAFCATRAEAYAAGTVNSLSKPACQGANGKAKLYAFQSPSCGRSSDQRPILDGLAAEFPDDLELIYVCTPIFAGDEASCARQVASGEYDE